MSPGEYAILLFQQVPGRNRAAAAARAQLAGDWRVVTIVPTATSYESHIHACAEDADFSSARLYVGCDYNKQSGAGRSYATQFDPGSFNGGNPPWTVPLPLGSPYYYESQCYGVRSRTACGVVRDTNHQWWSCLWRWNGSWTGPFVLTAPNGSTETTANDTNGYEGIAGGVETTVGDLWSSINGPSLPYFWTGTTPTALSLTDSNGNQYVSGSATSIDTQLIGGYVVNTGGSPQPALWHLGPVNPSLIVPWYSGGFTGGKVNDTFRWIACGVIGTGPSLSNSHAFYWLWDGAGADLHPTKGYTSSAANGTNGNAVVGSGVSSKDQHTHALYWPLTVGTAGGGPNDALVELPMPNQPNGTPYLNCQANDVSAGGDKVVGMAWNDAGNEQAVAWSFN